MSREEEGKIKTTKGKDTGETHEKQELAFQVEVNGLRAEEMRSHDTLLERHASWFTIV